MPPRIVNDNDQLATVTRIIQPPAPPKPNQPVLLPPGNMVALIGSVTICPAIATLIIAVAYQFVGGISPTALAVSSWVIWLIAMFTVAAFLETRQDPR